jgi:hypothetical protein
MPRLSLPGPGRAATAPVEHDITILDDGVVSINRRAFAVGLAWRPYEEGVALSRQARTITANTRAAAHDLVCDTQATGIIGFGDTSTGHRRGMPALVTAISTERLGDTWLGAFRLGDVGDTWWVGAMRQGQVFEDRIVKNHEDARSVLIESMDAPGWTAIIAPLDWNIDGSREDEIGACLDLRRVRKLRPISRLRGHAPRIVAIGVISALFAGVFGVWQWHQNAEAERLRQLAELQRSAVRVTAEDYPWNRVARIGPFLSACETAIREGLVVVAGWENRPLICRFSKGRLQLDVAWVRRGGKIGWLRASAPVFGDALRLDETGEQASAMIDASAPLDPASIDDVPLSDDLAGRVLRERFQDLGLAIDLKRIVALRAPPNKAIFNHHLARISFSGRSDDIRGLLEDLPALVPEALSYNPASAQWELAFRLHHTAILPVGAHRGP